MAGQERGGPKKGGRSPVAPKLKPPPVLGFGGIPKGFGGVPKGFGGIPPLAPPRVTKAATVWAAKHDPSVAVHLLVPPKPQPVAPSMAPYRRGQGPVPVKHKQTIVFVDAHGHPTGKTKTVTSVVAVPRTTVKPPTLQQQYTWAKKSPVDPVAAKKLADSMTTQERREVLHPETLPPPRPHPSLGSALLHAAVHGVEAAPGRLAHAAIDPLMSAAWGSGQDSTLPPEAQGALAAGVATGRGIYKPNEVLTQQAVTGPDLYKFLNGQPHSKWGLRADLAMAPLMAVGKPIRAGRVATQIAMNLGRLHAEGELSLPAIRSLANELYRGPSLLKARAATAAIKQANKIDAQLVEQAIKSGTLSKAHGEALRVYAATEEKVAQKAAAVKIAKGAEAKKAAETALKQAKDERATAKGSETYLRARAVMKTVPLPFGDPRLIQREKVIKDLLKNLKGSKNALPPGATKAQIHNLFQFLDTMTNAGVWGRHWYEDSAKAIKDMFPNDPVKQEQFAQLLAIYSPQQPIIGNTSLAIRSHAQWNAAETALREAEAVKGQAGAVTVGQDWQQKAAQDVLQGRADWNGRKTNNFYVNFLEDINPEKFRKMVADELAKPGTGIRPDGVTIDMWMARVFGYTSDDVTAKGRYDFMEGIVRQLAKERGGDWKPKQVQAAIWTAIKGMSDDVTANIDFSTGIERHFGQFNFQAASGSALADGFDEIHNAWPPAVKGIFQTLNGHLVDDFLREVGFIAERSTTGTVGGAPASATRFLTSAAPRAEKGKVAFRVYEPERVQINRAAAAVGQALKIDSVSWVRPWVGSTIKKAMDTAHVEIGRGGTEAEAQALWHALNPDGVERFTVLNSHDGFTVRNISDLVNNGTAKNPGFRQILERDIPGVFKDSAGKAEVNFHAADGETLKSGDYGVHLQGRDGSGPGTDLRFTEAADRLARDAADLRQRFIDASENFADASGKINPAAVRRELDRIEGLPWERAAVDDERIATEKWMAGMERDPAAAKGALPVDEYGNPIPGARAVTGPAALPGPEIPRDYAAEIEAIKNDPASWDYSTGSPQLTRDAAARWGELRRLQIGPASEALDTIARVAGAAPTDAVFLSRTRGQRLARSGDLVVHLPHARGRTAVGAFVPHVIEKTADYISKQIDATFLKAYPNVWVFGTSGEGARALKQAGRMKRMEPLRHRAEFSQEIRQIIQHAEGGAVDQAHYWYSQLPASHRNADGLQMIRDAQQGFLDNIKSGRARQEWQDKIDEAKAEQKRIRDSSEQGKAAIMNEQSKIEAAKEAQMGLLNDERNLVAQVKALDNLIANPPPVDETLLEALRTLIADREQTLTEAGRLKEEAVDERPGKLARELLLDPDGTEIYMGHRLGKDPTSTFSRFLPSIGTGRTKSPAGMGTNQLVLWRTGRLRPSMRIGMEDWQAASVFAQTTGMRNDIHAAGDAFPHYDPLKRDAEVTRLKSQLKDKVIVNIKGRVIPAHWKVDELSQFGEGWDEVKKIREYADEMMHGFISDSRETHQQMLSDLMAGKIRHQDLRVIDKAKLERYAKQFRSSTGRSTPGAVGDMLVDAIAMSIVTFRIGFIPKNVLQNLITMVPHQGPLMLRNLVRFAQVSRDPVLLDYLRAEAGNAGALSTLGKEASKMRKTGNVMREGVKVKGHTIIPGASQLTTIGDDPFRIAAYLHELAAEGVISNHPGLLSDVDRQKLLAFFKSKDKRTVELKNQVNFRANNAMPDFSRLTPDQARQWRRIAIIPGWLMAGSRWPFHFAATHPARSALLAFIAMGEPGAPSELRFNEPVTHYLHGRRYLRGFDTPWGRERTSSIDPVSTPWELAFAAKGSLQGKKSPFDYNTPTAFDFVAPGLGTLVQLSQGDLGNMLGVSGWKKVGNRLVPTAGLIGNMIQPPKNTKSYPGDKTRLGRLRRELGVLPIPVNDNPPSRSRKRRPSKKGVFDDSGGGVPSMFGGGGGTPSMFK